jgi:hypothetical protein
MSYLNVKDNARTQLDGELLSTEETSFDVVDGSVFPETNFVVTIGDEKILIESVTTNTLTIDTRGYGSTTPATHADESFVNLNPIAEHITELQSAVDAKAPLNVAINAQADNYTLVIGDAGKLVRVTHADAKTLTVPKNSAVAFPTGTKIAVVQGGAGQITIAPVDGDVTLESYDSALKLVGQYAGAVLIKRDTDTWVVEGNLE